MYKRIAIFDTAELLGGENIEDAINEFIKKYADDVYSFTCTHYRDSEIQFIYTLVYEPK